MKTSYRIIYEDGLVFECRSYSLSGAIESFRLTHPKAQIKEIWLTSASGKWLQIPQRQRRITRFLEVAR